MRGSAHFESTLNSGKHYYSLDVPGDKRKIGSRFLGLLEGTSRFFARPSTLEAVQNAAHSLQANSLNARVEPFSTRQESVLATSPTHIPGKLDALRSQLASAPASLQGHLHSACYQALVKSGDLTTRDQRGRTDSWRVNCRRLSDPAKPPSQHKNNGTFSACNQWKIASRSSGACTSARKCSQRPSSAAAIAAAEAEERRKRLHSAPSTLLSDNTCESPALRNRCSTAGRICTGSTLKHQLHSKFKRTLGEEEHLETERVSPSYNCWKSDNNQKKSRPFRELNYDGVTGPTGVPLDVRFMELKATNAATNTNSEYGIAALSRIKDAVKAMGSLGEEMRWQIERCSKLSRSLTQQKTMIKLIKRRKNRFPVVS